MKKSLFVGWKHRKPLFIILVIAICCAFAVIANAHNETELCVLNNDRIYVLYVAYEGEIYYDSYNLAGDGHFVQVVTHKYKSKEYPLKWLGGHGHLWLIDVTGIGRATAGMSFWRFPLKYLVRYDEHLAAEAREKSNIVIKRYEDNDNRISTEGDWFSSAYPIFFTKVDADIDVGKKEVFEYAFAVDEVDSIRVFLVYRGIMDIWSYKDPSYKKPDWFISNAEIQYWHKETTVQCPFTESFNVYSGTNEYYFVTASGNTHSWKLGSKNAPVKIWDADKAPVKTIIQDADSDKVYAFAGGQYFELAEKLEPKEYSRSLAQKIGMSPSKNQLIEMARIIRADQSATKKK